MPGIFIHKKVHFIGIGGVSMSALAHILLNNNITVTGSDATSSVATEKLIKAGAEIYIGQRAENIKAPDLVVYTAAIAQDNPELCAARNKGIKTMERADFLGQLMEQYEFPVSISGTHGKTTTTSMLSCVFLKAMLKPTILVGGEFSQINSNFYIGDKKYMIFEGCEYVDSFLKFKPKAAIILNIDADHLDYFSGIEQIKQSFNKFLKLIPSDSFAVINSDDKNVMDSLDGVDCELITYGKAGMWHAENISFNDSGCGEFDVYYNTENMGRVKLSVPGMHNVSNALGVFACSYKYGIDLNIIIAGLRDFDGAKRRFEYKGEFNGVKIYDDYAHHPVELETTITTARKLSKGKIWCVFQPHTYTRTKALLDDFAKVLSSGDNIIITEIYAAREKNTIGISGKDLADKIDGAIFIETFEEIAQYLKKNAKENDTVLTIGAGTITKLSQLLV